VTGAAVIGQIDAVAQSRVQKQLTSTRTKAFAIQCNLVAACHCPIPEGFTFPNAGSFA